jgi:hypothetical protein
MLAARPTLDGTARHGGFIDMANIADTTNRINDEAIQLSLERARIELDLLLNLAPGARQGLLIVEDLGITADSFSQPDLQAIFIALVYGRDADNFTRAGYCRAVLRALQAWDDTDTRPFIHGSIWGPEALARLFYCVQFDRGRLALHCCRLLQNIQQQRQLEIRGAA